MKKIDIKARAARDGKLKRTVSEIERTIAKLESMKDEYLKKAADAKACGDTATYSLAKSAINATLSQIKRSKEMLLNIRITSELVRMGDVNADFLNGMSVIAKQISKVNKKSDFVKLQKEIQSALNGVEEAQAGLEDFLNNSGARFAELSDAPSALSEKDIDNLVDGRVSEHELLMDAEIASLIKAAESAQEKTANASEASVSNAEKVKTAESDGGEAEPRSVDGFAQPFPPPHGAFDFSAAGAKSADLSDRLNVALPNNSGIPAVVLGKPESDETLCISLADAPTLTVCCDGADVCDGFVGKLVCDVVLSAAPHVKIMLIDCDGGLSRFNGMPQLVCNAISGRDESVAALTVLSEEIKRRAALIKSASARSAGEYILSHADTPHIVVVIDGIDRAVKLYGREFADGLARVIADGAAVGVYFVATCALAADTDRGAVVEAFNARISLSDFDGDCCSFIYKNGICETRGITRLLSDADSRRVVSALAEDRI